MPDTDDVLRADDHRFEAMRKQDWPALEDSLADDLVYVHSTARVETKAEHKQRFTVRYLAVYIRGAGEWRMTAWQSTRVPD